MLSSWKRRSKRYAKLVKKNWACFGLTWWYVPASAVFTLPSTVFTHLNGVQFAARLPEPVTIGRCEQPAFSTAGQQDSPSLITVLPLAKSRLASLSTSFLRKPLTTLNRSRFGLRSAVVSTAATIGVLPAAPRPRLPPGRSPPR